ncbi:MAG: hypothetical protein RR202_12175 [Bacteroidales bacterium]
MEITEVFEIHFQNYGEIELAEESFRESMKDNAPLKSQYRDWCDDMGYTDRKGFRSYFINKNDSESIWDSIFPNKEEYEEYEFDTM